LTAFLVDLGHRVIGAADSDSALAQMAHIGIRPDLVLADYNLPNELNGLELGRLLRQRFGAGLPVVILTGDISQETMTSVAAADCVQINKPVQLEKLSRLIQRMLPDAVAPVMPGPQDGTVFIVDDDPGVRTGITALLTHEGRHSVGFDSCEAFIEAYRPGPRQCLLVDAHLPGMGGLDLLRHMRDSGQPLSAIVLTGDGDVGMAVEAMKAGASDFIEKPVSSADLLASIARVLDLAHGTEGRQEWERQAADKIARLTARQHEIMMMVLDGHPSKNIAADLQISQRTVENHRAAIMHKTGSSSLPALARLAVAAAGMRGTAIPREQALPDAD
jgi:two-component system CheB/CheR fusion protein